MILTRRALRREVRIHETRARLDSDTIGGLREGFAEALARITSLQAELDAARAEPRTAGPALADNIRLAHQLEQAELQRHQAEGERDHLMGQLLKIAARHPHLLAPDEVGS